MVHGSGQIIIFHQPRFPWNKEISLTKPPFGVRSCEVDQMDNPTNFYPFEGMFKSQPQSAWTWTKARITHLSNPH